MAKALRRSAWAWLCMLTIPLPLRAQPSLPSPREQASQHFDRGLELVQGGSYELAVMEFERAYALSGSSSVLYNLGMAYVVVNRHVEACDTLTRYFEQDAQKLSRADATRVQEERQHQCESVGVIELDVVPREASAAIDGRTIERGALRGPLRIDLGAHALEVRHEGYAPSRSTITVTATAQRISVQLVPVSGAAPETPAKPPERPLTKRLPDREPSHAYARTGYGLAAAGVASGLAALTVYLISDGRHDKWREEDAQLLPLREAAREREGNVDVDAFNQRQDANNERWLSVLRLDKAAIGLAVGGAVLAAAGATLLVISFARRRTDKTAATQLLLRPGGLGMSQRF